VGCDRLAILTIELSINEGADQLQGAVTPHWVRPSSSV
jgi:hypothetical protein